jgi:hypothetical protein
MLIRWSDVANYNVFVATSSNQAGSFRIPAGSKLVVGTQGVQQGLIWSDLDLWSMRYLQPPLVFGFTKISGNCGLISARAKWQLGQSVYWMSSGNFYEFGPNGLKEVPCSVWDKVFRNLNIMQADKITAAGNADFSEITFYYPSAAASENDSYVKMNTSELDAAGAPLWDYGLLDRTAWEDRSVFGAPVGADVSGFLQQHEISPDADGVAMNSYFETAYADLEGGQDVIIADQFQPDFTADPGSTLYITFKTVMTARSVQKVKGPYSIALDTRYINARVRGRQLAIRVGSNDLGSFWRLGLIRYRGAPDGRQ